MQSAGSHSDYSTCEMQIEGSNYNTGYRGSHSAHNTYSFVRVQCAHVCVCLDGGAVHSTPVSHAADAAGQCSPAVTSVL